MKEVEYGFNGEPTCPECGEDRLEIVKIDNHERLLFNCVLCFNSGELYYAYIGECDSNTIDRLLKFLKRKKYQCQDSQEKKEIENRIQMIKNISV